MDIIIDEPDKGPPEFVPPLAIRKMPADEGRLFKSDQLGAPDAVFIKIAPVVVLGANKETAPVPLPKRRLLAVMEDNPVPPLVTASGAVKVNPANVGEDPVWISCIV
ncbi:unnamed protein product, partial [marine sediment metagenome]